MANPTVEDCLERIIAFENNEAVMYQKLRKLEQRLDALEKKECQHPWIGGLIGKPKSCMYCGKPVSEFYKPSPASSLAEKLLAEYVSFSIHMGTPRESAERLAKIAEAHFSQKLEQWQSNTWMNKKEFNIENLKKELFGKGE